MGSWAVWTVAVDEAAAPIGADTDRLLDACDALLAQRAAVAGIFDEPGPSWMSTRRALNEFHRVMNG